MHRTRGWLIGLAVTAAAALCACASTLAGSGHVADGAEPTPGTTFSTSINIGGLPSFSTSINIGPSQPSSPASSASSPAPNPLSCPHVSYAVGRLAFDCITPDLKVVPNTPVWELSLSQAVQLSTDGQVAWTISEGARKLAPLGSRTLRQVVLAHRSAMLSNDGYGPSPKVATDSGRSATVAGVPAYVLASTITINPAFLAEHGLTIRTEKLWIVALNAGDGNVAVWYVTVPDVARHLWSQVPALINSLGLI